jgi:hypothetical protein
MGLQVIRFSELYKEFLVLFSFVENYFTPNQLFCHVVCTVNERVHIDPESSGLQLSFSAPKKLLLLILLQSGNLNLYCLAFPSNLNLGVVMDDFGFSHCLVNMSEEESITK